jgi:hypothetical protein
LLKEHFKRNVLYSLIQIAERTFLLNVSREVLEKGAKFDLFIAPPELKNFKVLDPEKSGEVFTVGYNATKEKLKNAESLVEKLIRK